MILLSCFFWLVWWVWGFAMRLFDLVGCYDVRGFGFRWLLVGCGIYGCVLWCCFAGFGFIDLVNCLVDWLFAVWIAFEFSFVVFMFTAICLVLMIAFVLNFGCESWCWCLVILCYFSFEFVCFVAFSVVWLGVLLLLDVFDISIDFVLV